MSLQTPILFLVFNRPEYTARVFARIREVKPRFLFVVADGARDTHSEDIQKCKQVREIIQNGVDWDCQLKTVFRTKNFGCGKGPAHAITWFFEQVQEGIVLEDDCLPTSAFFDFCEAALTEFRLDERIIAVSGFNVLGEWKSNKYDYFFSDGGNWGWASWRRAWKLFDYEMSSWRSLDEATRNRVLEFYPDFDEMYKKITQQNYDAWDVQWHFVRLITNTISITPTRNLVQNIGFGANATHTFDYDSSFAKVPVFEQSYSLPLVGPLERIIDQDYRAKTLELSKTNSESVLQSTGRRVIGKAKGLMKRIGL